MRKITLFCAGLFSSLLATAQLSGSYTIDPALPYGPTNYQTIDSAVGALNQLGVNGAVTFNIKEGTYTESTILNAVTGASAVNTITFQPNPTNTLPVVMTYAATASADNFVFRIDGAKHVTLTGLTFTAGGTSFGRIIDIPSGDTITLTNNTFNGVVGAIGTTNIVSVYGSGTTTKRIRGLNVSNNTFNNGGHMVYISGSSSNKHNNFVCNNNTMSGFGGYGFYLSYAERATVIGNTLNGSTSSTSTMYGIYIGGGTTVATQLVRAVVRDNEMVLPTSSTAYGIYLVGVNATMTEPSEVINNMVILGSTGTGTRYAFYSSQSNYLNLWHNSFQILDGSTTLGRTIFFTRSTTGFADGNVDMRNNVASNIGGGYAFEMATNVTTAPGYFTNLNYNAYYSTGVAPFRYGTTAVTDLLGWQTSTSAEGNSLYGDPLFNSTTDLHVAGPLLNNVGTPLAGVTTDIDGQTRSLTTPDIGADEYTPLTCFPVSGIGFSAITGTSASVSWTSNNSSTIGHQVEIGLAGFSLGTGTRTNGTGTTNSFTGLIGTSTYDVYVREICAIGDTGGWSAAASFNTAIIPAWLEPFNSYPPTGWTEAQGNIANPTSFTSTTSSGWTSDGFINVGTTGAMKENLFSTGDDEWAISPAIDLGTGTIDYQLEFDVAVTPWNGTGPATMDADDSIMVVISTDGGATWNRSNALKVYGSGNVPSNLGQHEIVSLVGYTGVIKIGFYDETTVSGSDLDVFFDNVEIKVVPNCPQPTNAGVFNVTDVDATFYFTSGGAANAKVQYGAAGFTPGTGTTIATTNDTLQITGLTAGTSYDVYVKDSCGVGNISAWTGPVSFNTAACPTSNQCTYTFNLIDDFGDGWNGGLIGVRQNGVIQATIGAGFTSGGTFADAGQICDSTLTELVVLNTGSYPGEMGFTVVDPSGSNIYTLPVNSTLTTNQVLATFTTQCTVVLCPITDTVTTVDGTTCGNTSATLGAVQGNPNYNVVWFDADTTLAGNGYSFNTPNLTTTSTYYAAFVSKDGTPSQHVGPQSTIGTNTTSGNFSNGLFFTALSSFRLDSMDLRALNGPVVGNIRIWDTTGAPTPFSSTTPGTLVASVPFSVQAGITQIPVGLDLTAGNYFANVQYLPGTTGQLFRSTGGAVYPYTVNNVVSLTGTDFATQTRYYYLFDWVVSTTCVGPLSPATATWQPLPSNAIPYAENFDSGLPCNWVVIDSTSNGATWEPTANINGSTLNGSAFVALDDDGAGSSAITESYLYSPVFDGVGYDTLYLTFDHYYRHLTGSSGAVEVFDGSAWVTLQTYTSSVGAWSNPDSAYFNLKPYQNANLQIRFAYDDGGAYAWYWAIDNFAIDGQKTPCSDVIVHIVTDIFGSETTWSIADSASGLVVASGGPYADVNPYNAANATHVDTLCLPIGGTFVFQINDSYGDGLVDGTNTGTYTLMRICPQGLDTVLAGSGAYPYGGVAPLPNPSYDSIVFDLTCPAIPSYDVTFQVNMNQQTVSPNGVYLAGNFQGWMPAGTAMSDANSDGIWDVTVNMPAGGIEYKFLNDSAWTGAETVPGACEQNGNRFATISSDTTLSVVCFGQCTHCTPLVNVTFRVDMSDEASISPDGVHVAGNFQGFDPAATPMTDANADGIYEVTVQVNSNDTLLYKFINGNTFAGVENSSQLASCGQGDGFGGFNRKTGIGTADTTLDVVCFTLCTACPIGLDEELLQSSFSVFPNPSKGMVSISFESVSEVDATLEVVDLAGQVVYREAIANHRGAYHRTLNLTDKAAGMYLVRLHSAEGTIVRRMAIH